MTYSLHRLKDEAGDSGQMSMALWKIDDEESENFPLGIEHDARPRIGVAMRVGSLYARSFKYQDYWQTTIITEILEESENYVKFKTTNSIYEWKQF